jgi:hypothetical protein
MKLDPEQIKFINKIVTTAQLVGIDSIIIEPNSVRGMDEDKTVVMLQSVDVLDMPFNSIGLNRLSTFLSRYDIAKTQDGFTMEAVVGDGDKFARSITMKGKGVKIDYRCANPTTISAPKVIKDVAEQQVQLNGEAVMLYQKGLAAMGSEVVTIISNEGVSFEFSDNNADVFNHKFADDTTELVSGSNNKFAHKYQAKVLLSLFKHDPDGSFTVGKAGTLNIEVNGVTITLLPRV